MRFARVRRTSGIDAERGFLKREGDLVVPARSHGRLLLDQAHLTNAYAVLETSGGKGSTISLTYAEALKDKDGLKGNRNEIDGKTIEGVKDVFRPDGGEHRSFQTLWFRTYRYVQLEVETGGRAAAHPRSARHLHGLPVRAARALRQRPALARRHVGDGLARARLCAWETYFDTPYYEQLQYVGDTRVQALISLYMSGDDRLVRQAIRTSTSPGFPRGSPPAAILRTSASTSRPSR